ncbi:MAG: acylneuraminate cytidylyltransferase [bacterium]
MAVRILLQARMASTRLPGKVCLPLGSGRIIDWAIARLSVVGPVTLCTSDQPTDDTLVESVPCEVLRGSEDDVLGRFILALHDFDGIVVRATGDNPLVLPELARDAIATLERDSADYCSIEGSALGTTVEVLTADALRRIHGMTTVSDEREHATLGILRRPDQFHIVRYIAPPEYSAPSMRLTIDTPEDYARISTVVDRIGKSPVKTTWDDICRAYPYDESTIELQRGLREVQQLKEAAWRS